MMNRLGFGAALLLSAAATAGCSGDEEAAFAEFVGDWEYLMPSTATLNCPTVQPPMEVIPLDGGFIEIKEEGTDAAVVTNGLLCPYLRLDVAGMSATAKAGQKCDDIQEGTVMGMAVTITTTITVSSLSFMVNGLNATTTATGTLSQKDSRSPTTIDCSLMLMGTLKKVAK